MINKNIHITVYQHYNLTTVSARFNEFGFNESSRFNKSVFDFKYFFTS